MLDSAAPSWSESPLDSRWGSLPLDFSNTADWHEREVPVETLTDYGKLVEWSAGAGLLGQDEAKRLLQSAAEQPAEAEVVLLRAIELREAIYRMVSAAITGMPANGADLEILNRAEAEALNRLRLGERHGGLGWEWTVGSGMDLDAMLWPVAHVTALLLTSPELGRVKKCAGDPCGWLFLDTSRNQTRRWCDMKDCGNRAKARRFYARRKGEGTGTRTG